jgi:hypothetical protein
MKFYYFFQLNDRTTKVQIDSDFANSIFLPGTKWFQFLRELFILI